MHVPTNAAAESREDARASSDDPPYLELPITTGAGAGSTVLINKADLEAILKAGVRQPFWVTFSGNGTPYVRCSCSGTPGGQVTVARLILGAGPGENVRCRNGNTLDLRRSNLVLVPGHARRRDHEEASEWAASGRMRQQPGMRRQSAEKRRKAKESGA